MQVCMSTTSICSRDSDKLPTYILSIFAHALNVDMVTICTILATRRDQLFEMEHK